MSNRNPVDTLPAWEGQNGFSVGSDRVHIHGFLHVTPVKLQNLHCQCISFAFFAVSTYGN